MTPKLSSIVGELRVHDLSKKTDADTKFFVAYKDRLFLVDDESTLEKVAKHFEDHPALKKPQLKPFDDEPYQAIQNVGEYAPDIVTGSIDVATGNIQIFTGTEVNPKTSLMVKKVAKQLKAKKIAQYKSDYHGDDVTLSYRQKDLIGGIPKAGFHGTTTAHLEDILSVGLAPGKGESKWQKQGIYHNEHVFFAATFHDAAFYAHNAVHNSDHKWNNWPVVLEFTIPDPAKVGSDYDADQLSTGPRQFDTQQDNHYNVDKSDMKSMGLSREVGKWSYQGRIPAQFIKWVYYYNNHEKKWHKSTPATWRKLLAKTDWEMIGYRLGMDSQMEEVKRKPIVPEVPEPQNPGVRVKAIQARIAQLEKEWEHADATGNPQGKQKSIGKELYELNKELLQWKLLHRAVDSAPGEYGTKI